MNLKLSHCKRALALLLCALTLMSLLPSAAFAGQVDDYHDPAEHWMTSSNRTNQLDVNSIVTQETLHCYVCGTDTPFTVWRVPEYTRDGVSALSRNVQYSDGTTMDGSGVGNVNDGTPGVDATYTGFHWTKSSCNMCGSFNANHDMTDYNFCKNIYKLYDCAAEFMDDLDEHVHYEYVDDHYHRKTVHGGTYCVFCYGTRPTETVTLERHTLELEILPQLSNQRFALVEHCSECEYVGYSFVAAKCVIADYYGVVDGEPHTVTISDLSEPGVTTAIRYGNSAESCTLTSAPKFTEEGQYVVYYEITYSYKGVDMIENGVAYVWLHDESGDYTEAAGHKPGDWIIDKQPTTSAEGSRHRECSVCHVTLETAVIEKLYTTATTDTKGEVTVGDYLVTVTDSASPANPIANATVTLGTDGAISIRLPDGRLLDYNAQTVFTVQRKADKSAVANLVLVLTDKNGNAVTTTTDAKGKFSGPAVSAVTDSDGRATLGYTDDKGNRQTVTVRLIDHESGRPVAGALLTVSGGKLTVSLPKGYDLDDANRITVYITDEEKKPAGGMEAVISNDLGNKASGSADADGVLTLPSVIVSERHVAYIQGYPDGTFGPEKGMTRAEAAAIFARLLAARNGDSIPANVATKFADAPAGTWYSGYVKYLSGYGVITGSGGNLFEPDREITRAEFVALAVRFYAEYADGVELTEGHASFSDVRASYWAAAYIDDAAGYGWITGYEDGSFRAANRITRAEVVTIVNRVLDREADSAYLGKNLALMTTFPDVHEKTQENAAGSAGCGAGGFPSGGPRVRGGGRQRRRVRRD